ncbi:MAG TPA: PSD1 and planctomycete cytochrome C domain-containing protein [Caulifigura sp.]|nr:PSD1 and planctomycete cytochrome C domain-containing protein [Caulifigura sp.]
MRLRAITAALLILITSTAAAQAPSGEAFALFEQKIRPVLVEQCYSCHSVQARDSKKLQAGLYLDTAAGVLKGGENGPALVAGKPAESLLIKALKYDGLEMPPSGKLSEEVIANFTKWIEMGAPDPRGGETAVTAARTIDLVEGRKWWSFQPLKIQPPPVVRDASRSPTPIDQFIVAAQEKQGLKPNSPASREKLIRRAYFDVIGLPPTPEQVDAFLKDESPRAFEKVVDALLESPRYGEKWARHWLDVARFAESGGYEFDAFRPGAYHYRDWVIQALNRDLPYDEFVRMQLAGDKLDPDGFQAAAASGFLVAGPYPGQITAKTVERIRYDQLDDMLMTIGGSMLGLTLGCVRCHDHKYDPLPQADYYALAASLAKTQHGPRALDPDPAATQQALRKHQEEHAALVATLRTFADAELPSRVEAWRKSEQSKQPDRPRWQVLEPISLEAERSWLKWLPDGVIAHDGLLVPGTNLRQRGRKRIVAGQEKYRITLHTHQQNITALRLDAFSEKKLPQGGPGVNPDGSFELADLKITASPRDPASKEAPIELKLTPTFAAFADKDQPLGNAVDDKPATAWVVRTTAKNDNAAVFELETPLKGFPGGTQLNVEMSFKALGIGRLRWALSTRPNPASLAGDVTPQHVGEVLAILAANQNTVPADLRESMARWFAPLNEETSKFVEAVRQHAAAEPRPPLTELYATVDGGQDVYRLKRGEVDNKDGKAEPGVLQVLWRGEAPQPAGSTDAADPRIRLADWMTDVDHGAGPLLARVMANRVWQHHFGTGLVATPNDFGTQGSPPTHPELLEWLASQLVSGGWKLKPLHRQIMLSAVYQQSHEISQENLKLDPANRFLWHDQPRRLEAELIRDALLAVGGNLDSTMYGPSVLAEVPRRSIYLRVKRSELLPIMTMFDAPEPTQSIGERVSTTVPTQALAMMNSPFVREQAAKLARQVRPTPDVPIEAAIARAYQIALARKPSPAEQSAMEAFVESQGATADGQAISDAAIVEFCQVLLSLNEFVYVD